MGPDVGTVDMKLFFKRLPFLNRLGSWAQIFSGNVKDQEGPLGENRISIGVLCWKLQALLYEFMTHPVFAVLITIFEVKKCNN